MDIYKVEISVHVLKILKYLPKHIILKLQAWIDDIGARGLSSVKKVPGYHDEPLKGTRKGQRSIRLSKAYRAIYIIDETKQIYFINIIEVNKHEY